MFPKYFLKWISLQRELASFNIFQREKKVIMYYLLYILWKPLCICIMTYNTLCIILHGTRIVRSNIFYTPCFILHSIKIVRCIIILNWSVYLVETDWFWVLKHTCDVIRTELKGKIKQAQSRAAADQSRDKSYRRIQYQGLYFPT